MAWGVPKLGTLVEDATGNFDLIEPAGVAEGDLMVACIAYRGNASITRPTGWSIVATEQNSGDTDATNGIASGDMFYIVRGSSAPSLTCTRTAGDVVLARVISYTPSAGTVPVYDTGSANTLALASVTGTTGTITTAKASELIVAMASGGDAYTVSAFDAATDPTTASGATDTTTAPTNGTWIERHDSSTGTGADATLAIADAVRATAGATGTIQCTFSGSARQVMIAGAFMEENKINVSDSVNVTDTVRVIDTYDFSNLNGSGQPLYSTGNNQAGQSFTGDGNKLKSISLRLSKTGTPTGNITGYIYAHSGTYGTSSVPTGAALATSATIDIATLTTSFTTQTFEFTGANAITLDNATNYVLAVENTNGDLSNRLNVGYDTTSPTASGNMSRFNVSGGAWVAEPTVDLVFIVNTNNPGIEIVTPVGGDLSINKSDTITVTESVTMFTDQLYRSVSDNITITESIGRLVENYVNKSENITITENKVVEIPLTVNVSDSITVSESTNTQLEITKAVSDTITITENRSLLIPELFITASDNVTITESINKDLIITTNVSDNITVTENADPELLSFISKSDSVTITENTNRLVESYVNKSDNVTITESTSVSIPELLIIKSESVTVTESAVVGIVESVSTSDSITVTESTTLLIPTLFINASESISISESVTVLTEIVGVPQIIVSDSVAITESTSLLINDLYVAVFDSITLTESVNLLIPDLYKSVNDSITITESLKSELNSYINKSESITVSENTSVYHDINVPTLQISVSDNVTLTEVAGRLEESYVNRSDSVTISENVNTNIANYNLATSENILVTENIALEMSEPVPPVPYRLFRGARGTLLGSKQYNFVLPKRSSRQTRPPRSYR